MTEKLYVKDVYLKEAELTLSEVKEEKGKLKAAFSSSLFFPEGGGQLCDTGEIAGYTVTDVKEDKESGTIWHTLEPKAGAEVLEPGKSYTARLDWKKRFEHMQMHCGEHILSGAFYKLYGAVNKGFHMGAEYTTIDIDLPEDSPYKEISPEMAAAAERLANEAVWADLPVQTIFFDTADEARKLPVRKAIKFEEDISVVVVGDLNDPADCCACCGTHPKSSGQIGIIKITHTEKYKGMYRCYVKCGFSAYEDYCEKQLIADTLGLKYSCDPKDLEKTLAAAETKTEEIYKKYSSLKGYYLRKTEEEFREKLKTPKEKSIRIECFEQFPADDLQTMLRKMEDVITEPVALVSPREHTAVLASSGAPDCGKIVKECAPIYHGKGGGKPNIARAIFEKAEDLELFLDLVEKHLR